MNPALDRNRHVLEQLGNHEIALKDIKDVILNQPILNNSGIKQGDLLKFPKFRRNQEKILIEYSDCIIQANDIADF